MTESQNKPAAALEPCPFCGGTEAFVERLDYSSAYVQCDSDVGDGCACLARGPVAVQDDDGEEIPGGAGAILAWNRRAPKASAVPESAVPAIIDAMQKIAEALAYRSDAQAHQAYIAIKAILAEPQSEEAPAAPVYGCGLGCVCTATFQHNECNADHSTLSFAAPTSRVQPSIADDQKFMAMLRLYGRKEALPTEEQLVAEFDAKLTQAHKEKSYLLKEVFDLQARAEKAEAQLAAIRTGMEGLTRYWIAPGGNEIPDPDGELLQREDVIALLQPQQKSDTPR